MTYSNYLLYKKILKLFDKPQTTKQIIKKAHLPNTTAYRIIEELKNNGTIKEDRNYSKRQKSKKYKLV